MLLQGSLIACQAVLRLKEKLCFAEFVILQLRSCSGKVGTKVPPAISFPSSFIQAHIKSFFCKETFSNLVTAYAGRKWEAEIFLFSVTPSLAWKESKPFLYLTFIFLLQHPDNRWACFVEFWADFTHCENVYNAQRDPVKNCIDSSVKWCLNSDCWLAGYWLCENKQKALPKIFLSVICSALFLLLQGSLCGHPSHCHAGILRLNSSCNCRLK